MLTVAFLLASLGQYSTPMPPIHISAVPVTPIKGVSALDWHWTRNPNGLVRWEWGHKDSAGRVVISRAMPTRPEPNSAPGNTSTNHSNYGLRTDYYPKPTDREWFGGNAPSPVGASEGKANERIHLTVIGPKSERDSAVRTLESDPAFSSVREAMGDRLAVQSYEATDPMVAGVGLPGGGRPDIVIQKATGEVTYRAQTFPGPAKVVEEIRKADPQYVPANDPNGSGLALDSVERFAKDNQNTLYLIICLLGLLLIWKKS